MVYFFTALLLTYTRVAQIFQKRTNNLKILGDVKGDVKQLPYWGPVNIRPHRTKFSLSGDLASGICAPLT